MKPAAVGTHAVTLTDAARNRTLRVQLWYPTTAVAADTPPTSAHRVR